MEPILEVSNLCKRFPGFSLENISFRLEAGQIMGFLGRNGAGKTTTIKAILNLCHPDSGTVRILGQPLDAPGVRARIGYAAGGPPSIQGKPLGPSQTLPGPFIPNGMRKPTAITAAFSTWFSKSRSGPCPRA